MFFLRSLLLMAVKSCILFLASSKKGARCQLTEMKSEKNTKTLFILGAGPSISRLDAQKEEVVKKSVSIGINSFVVSDICPDFLSLEEASNDEAGKKKQDYLFQRAFESFTQFKKPHIFYYFRGLGLRSLIEYFSLKEHDCVTPYGGIYLRAKEPWMLSKQDRLIINFVKLFFGFRLVIACRSSVDRLIWLGATAGFDNIVLCGVDLTSSKYFWSENSDLDLLNDQSGMFHTSLRLRDNMNSLDGINGMIEIVKVIFGTNVERAFDSQEKLENLQIFKWK